MAARFLDHDISDLILGKPPLRSLPSTATAAEALAELKRSGERFISVWSCDHNEKGGCVCVGRICLVDLICFLCREENLSNPSEALQVAVSDVMVKGGGVVRHLNSNSSLLEAIDCILEGAQHLVIPIKTNKSNNSRKKHLNKPLLSLESTLHNGIEYCWLTQEDIVRYLLNSISTFSPLPTQSLESLNIIETTITTVHFNDPMSSAITHNLTLQKPIAILDDENKLKGEISPYNLSYCEDALTIAASMTTLSATDLMAFVYYNAPEDLLHLVQMRLKEKHFESVLESMEDLSLSYTSSSASCSSDEEFGPYKGLGFGRISPPRRNSEAIVCHPWSSLVAVMVQALAYRANYVWVIKEDCSIAGIVTFEGILKVFRSSVSGNLNTNK